MPKRVDPPRARYGDPNWETDGANWPRSADSVFYRVGGFVWHVQQTGTGPTAVLLHGTGAGTHSWAPMIPKLADRLTLITVDLPGHGFTQSPRAFRPSLPNMCRALQALFAELKLQPDLIIGHSAGAAIAIHLVARHRQAPSLLVSINGALKPFDGMMRTLAPTIAKVVSFGGLAARLVSRTSSGDDGVRKLIQNTGSDPERVPISPYAKLLRRRGHIQGALQMMAHWDLTYILEDCSKLSMPIVFIAAEGDKAVPSEVSRHATRQAAFGTYFELPSLGHLAHEEDPARVAEIILNALDRIKVKPQDKDGAERNL
ncbi:MAG: alpha/beta fold hydrolase BchO [Pseudomonadota bacterium]